MRSGTDATCGYRYVYPRRGKVIAIHTYPVGNRLYAKGARFLAIKADGSRERREAFEMAERAKGWGTYVDGDVLWTRIR